MRRHRLARYTPVLPLLLVLGAVAPPPAAAGPSVCDANVCTVGSESHLLQALDELDALTNGVARIELAADVTLTSGESDPVYDGTQELIIDGNGFDLDGAGTSQILVQDTTAPLGFQDITIENGAGNGGQGAVSALGEVSATDSTITGNVLDQAGFARGGAITAVGTIEVDTSQITNNEVRSSVNDAFGGALYSEDQVLVIGSTVSGNLADASGNARGGAVYGESRVVFENSLVIENDATGHNSAGGAAMSETAIAVTDTELVRNDAGPGAGSSSGGALYSDGIVEATRSTFDHSRATGTSVAQGGALTAIAGDITVEDSIMAGNDARATNSIAQGGAVFALNGPDITVTGSTLRDNHARSTNSSSEGGGIFTNNGDVDLVDTAVVRNLAQGPSGRGGGIDVTDGQVSAYDTTIAGNIAETGGGIRTDGAVDLRFATVVDNNSPGSAQIITTGTMFAAATVVAKPVGFGAVNCAMNNTISQVANFDSGTTCGFGAHPLDVDNGGDPLIGPARDNGGPRLGPVGAAETTLPLARFTAHPLLGSPLIDVMDPATCNQARNGEADLIDDQRDEPRPVGFECDIGAMEALFPAHGFTDVTSFYEPTVRWITSEINTPNILDGFDDNTFRHTLNITRGQAARLYYRAAGQPDVDGLPQLTFTDVTPFYQDAVRWAKAFGVFDGYANNTFRQANPITRGNYIRSLYGFAGSPDVSGLPQHGLTDVTAFYEDAVRWAKGNGLANGYNDNTFRQTNNITRGDASRTAFNLAQSPAAWDQDSVGAHPNMLFNENY